MDSDVPVLTPPATQLHLFHPDRVPSPQNALDNVSEEINKTNLYRRQYNYCLLISVLDSMKTQFIKFNLEFLLM